MKTQDIIKARIWNKITLNTVGNTQGALTAPMNIAYNTQ